MSGIFIILCFDRSILFPSGICLLIIRQPTVYFLFCRILFDFFYSAVNIGSRKHFSTRTANQMPQILIFSKLLAIFVERISPYINIFSLKTFTQLIKSMQIFIVSKFFNIFIYNNFSVLFISITATTLQKF